MISPELLESFRMARESLRAHRLRSALTLLGVVAGVFAIVAVMTAMRGYQSYVESELSQLGAQTFQIEAKRPGGGSAARRARAPVPPITLDQFLTLAQRARLPRRLGAEMWLVTGQASSRFGTSNPDVGSVALTPEAFAAKNWTLSLGRAFATGDSEMRRRVCILEKALAQKLFPRSSPLGESVQYDGVEYTVVGVLDPIVGMFGEKFSFIAIPLSTGLSQYGRQRSLTVYVQARSQALYQDTMDEARWIFRAVRRVPASDADDFRIVSNESVVAQYRSQTSTIRKAVMIISSVGLIAAGVGIMNIMLVAVTERTREIGIRRAVGAKRRSVLFQFVLEAVIICEVGGVVGIAFGLLAGNLAAWFLRVPAALPADWILLAAGVSSAVGIVFGAYPAFIASRLDPVQALRHE